MLPLEYLSGREIAESVSLTCSVHSAFLTLGAAPAGQVWEEKSSLVLGVLGPGEGQVPFLVLLKTPGWL